MLTTSLIIETTEEMSKIRRLNISNIPLNCIKIFKKILDNQKKLLNGISECYYMLQFKIRALNIKLN